MVDLATIPDECYGLEEIERQTTLQVNHRTPARRGRTNWGLPPNIARASASREKKPQLPVAVKPAPVEVVEVAAIAPAPIAIHGRVLAKFSDYNGLHRAIAARATELQLTRHELDFLSGNLDGYSAKVLSPTQYRKFGPVSLGNTVGALGCYLLLIENETETRKLLSSPPRPKATGRHHGGSISDLGEKLGAIGCTLALIEDPRATEKMMKRAKQRRQPLRQLKLLPPPACPDKGTYNA
jgi:hypothetical protein